MKKELITIAGIFLALGLSFFIFSIQKPNFTGFAVYNESSGNVINDSNKIVNQTIITKDDALLAINESEIIILEMKNSNLSTVYAEDALGEAKMVFEQALSAQILRREINSTELEKNRAREALRLVKWQKIGYGDIIPYTEDIKKRKDAAFLLLDKIAVEESETGEISESARGIFEQAKTAFYEERYGDSEKLIEDFKTQVEKERVDASTLTGIKNGAKNFFQRYWIYITIMLVFAFAAGYILFKRFEKKLIKNKIKKMKAEEKVLNELKKRAQIERFKENKISGLIYNIRMKKYEERLLEIKEELPVLEKRLEKDLYRLAV